MLKPCAACGGTGQAIIPYRGGKGYAETLDEAKWKPVATRKTKCTVCKGLQVVEVPDPPRVEHVPPQRVRFTDDPRYCTCGAPRMIGGPTIHNPGCTK